MKNACKVLSAPSTGKGGKRLADALAKVAKVPRYADVSTPSSAAKQLLPTMPVTATLEDAVKSSALQASSVEREVCPQ